MQVGQGYERSCFMRGESKTEKRKDRAVNLFLSATERAAGSLEKNHRGILSACHVGDPGSIPGSGTSPGEGNGYPLQCSFLENPMDRGAWRASVHGVARVGRNLVTKPPPPQRSQRERMFQGGCHWQCHQPKSMLTVFSWGWLLDTNIRASTFLCVNIPDLFEEPSSARSSFYEAYGCGDSGRMAQGLLKLPMVPPELSSTLPPRKEMPAVTVGKESPQSFPTNSFSDGHRAQGDLGHRKEKRTLTEKTDKDLERLMEKKMG